MEKKLFKYYVIRIANAVIFRRTVGHIQKVKSLLYRRGSDFRLEQITYIGGRVIGSMSYDRWVSLGGRKIANNNCFKISREQFRSMDPYMQKGL